MVAPWEEETPNTSLAPWEEARPKGPVGRGRPVNRQATELAFPKTWDEYQQTGKPLSVLGQELPIRLQQGVTNEGRKRTYFVPPPISNKPTGSAPLDVMIGADKSLGNMAVGGALEAGRASLALGEYLLETAGLDDKSIQFIEENFPTLPAGNNIEKAGQEIMSVLYGAATGNTLLSTIAKYTRTPEKVTQILSTFKKNLRDDPNAFKKMQLMVRGVLTEFGEILGASATTPPEQTPISEQLGIVPDGDNNVVGNIVDNAAFSVLARLIGVGLGALGKKVDQKFLQGFRPAERNKAALQWLKAVDPLTPDNIPGEEINRRAKIMADVLQKYKMFEIALTGKELPLDTSMAMMQGANEYMRRTYGYMEQQMGSAKFAEFVEQGVRSIVSETLAIKQGMKSNREVALSDANFLDTVGSEMETAANSFPIPGGGTTTPAIGHDVGVNIGRQALNRIDTSQNALTRAKEEVAGAGANLDTTLSDTQLMQMLEEARDTNKLGGSMAQRMMREELTGPNLLAGFQKAKQRVTEAFRNVPSEKIDPTELANLIASSGNIMNPLEDFGIPATAGGMKTYNSIPSPDSGLSEIDELALSLEQKGVNDVNYILNEIWPQLSKRINAAYVARDPMSADQIHVFRRQLGELIGKSKNPAIQNAMNEYKEFADTWLGTQPLRQYEAAASQVHEVGGGFTPKGQTDAFEIGGQMFEASRNAYTDAYLTKFVLALQTGDPNASQEISQFLVGEALNTLVKKTTAGSRIPSQELLNSIAPYTRTLENIDPNGLIKDWHEAVQKIQIAEQGLKSSEDVLDEAQALATKMKEEAATGAARFFLGELTRNPGLRKNSQDAWRQLFNATDAPLLVGRLLEQMKTEKNTLAIAGLKSEYLRYLRDKIFTNRPVGVTGDTASPLDPTQDAFVRDLSGSRLKDALSSDYSHDMSTLREIFKDEPKTGDAVVALMTTMHNMVNSRATKVNPFGSNTVVDATLQKSVNTLIMLTLGVLNRTATTARAVTGTLTLGHNDRMKQAYDSIFSQIVTNPQFVSEALENVSRGRPIKEFLGVVTKGAIRGSIMQRRPTEDVETEEALGGNITPEEMQSMEQQASVHTNRPIEQPIVSSNMPPGYEQDERGFIRKSI